jgi:RNA polymerase sigma-70 factor (sigma-E family)
MSWPGPVAASTGSVSGVQFEQYVTAARQRLYRFAVVLCGDPVLASDLVTDVLGRAFERWQLVSAARDPHAYVRRMLVNEFLSWKRRRARAVPYSEVADLADQQANRFGTGARDHGDVHAERTALLAELARLPARQRAAIVLRYYEDLCDDDIAAVLGCRLGTVRSIISRGLATLRVTITSSHDRTV